MCKNVILKIWPRNEKLLASEEIVCHFKMMSDDARWIFYEMLVIAVVAILLVSDFGIGLLLPQPISDNILWAENNANCRKCFLTKDENYIVYLTKFTRHLQKTKSDLSYCFVIKHKGSIRLSSISCEGKLKVRAAGDSCRLNLPANEAVPI